MDEHESVDLATAYAELQHLVLDSCDVSNFLTELAKLATSIAPGTHCGITLRREDEVWSVAASDSDALRMDEIQYLHGRGPCLEALRTGTPVEVPDITEVVQWGDYREYALAHGVRSTLSLPLVVDDVSIGALNLFAPTAHAFSGADVARVQAFTTQAAMALTILLRQARMTALDEQLAEALATRAVIDQALGILMYTRRISASEAFNTLRHASQTTNRKVSVIAAEVVHTMTGHPPEPPRPLSQRD
jgi:GAF domain-containing protein